MNGARPTGPTGAEGSAGISAGTSGGTGAATSGGANTGTSGGISGSGGAVGAVGGGSSAGSGGSGYAGERLRLLQDGALDGAARRGALARLTDGWLAGLFGGGQDRDRDRGVGAGVSCGGPGGGGRAFGAALVAVGGYGHGELSPRSDLDLLLLHDGTASAGEIAALADRLWYPVWDLGLALDHSVRTLAEALGTAGEDLKTQLGLLDARHLAGDPALTAELRAGALAQWRAQAPTRLPELRELSLERGRRHGELRFLLEPDLKEAQGGLRDLTALRAVAASWLADAPREGLAEARGTLLDVRDALHLTTGRAGDRLALQDQDAVAAALGLLDADVLLRQVYEAAGTVGYACEVTWREVGRVLRARSAPSGTGRAGRGSPGGGQGLRGGAAARRTPLADGVVEHEGEAALAWGARPERDPVLPLRAAAAAARAGLPLAAAAARKLARTAPDLPVPWPPEAREEFVTLLGAGPAAVPVWEALEAAGIIARLLPDWERVRCRPQRNAVHRFTVDRHLVETAVRAGALARRVRRPDLLLVAALLHDMGKGWPGDHAVSGAVIARETAALMGFEHADAETLGTLVRHHLLLVETATRRDLDDPATVRHVAEAVTDPGTLELLHALTEADALATGPAAWSAWRSWLVSALVKRVGAVLAGAPVPESAAPRATGADDRLAREAWRTGGPVLALRPHAAALGNVRTEGTGPELQREPVGVELSVALPERPGVLPAVAGVLALHRLTVRTADLRLVAVPVGSDEAGGVPGADGIVGADEGRPVGEAHRVQEAHRADRGEEAEERASARVLLLGWRVAAEYGSLPQAARLRADLVRALDGSLDIAGKLAEREAAQRGARRPAPAPPRVTVAPGGSRTATVLDVRAQDAPGLLHRIGSALETAGVRVRSARVSTLGAHAVDAFYVTDARGAPLSDAAALGLAERLEAALR